MSKHKRNEHPIKKVYVLFLLACMSLAFIPPTQEGASLQSRLSREAWVDSVFNALNEDQRLGQLFMVAAYSNRDETHYREIESLVRNHHIGGLIFFQGGPGRQAVLTNRYQKAAKVPLIIGMDLEWGLQMRLDSTMQFPKAMTLGAIDDDRYIYDMGKEIARQCRELGVHINFAPVVDVNSNPQNPVIGYRSFGEDKYKVARKGIAYMKGMQDHGVLASAKHFPGHGDTDSDSHYTLPVLKHDRTRLDTLELYPFRELIREGVASIMVAHLAIPALEPKENTPTTLSYNVVTRLLKEEMGYDGLIFTDALNMKGVSQFYQPGEVDLLALKAGNDVMLFSEDVPRAVGLVKEAFASGELKREDIYQRVKKILGAKYDVGLHQYQPIKVQGLYQRLNTVEGELLRKKLFERSSVVLENKDDFLPLKNLENHAFASLQIGGGAPELRRQLDKYAPFTHFSLPAWDNSPNQLETMGRELENFSTIVVSLHGITNSPRNNHGLGQREIAWLRDLQKDKKVVVIGLGNAYSIRYALGFDHQMYFFEDNALSRSLAAQMIFGALPSYGQLPVSPSPVYPVGYGIRTEYLGRLMYTLPEEVDMDSEALNKIDGIVEKALRMKATPGAQVLVARKGAVIYDKNFGYTDYSNGREVDDQTLYDLASLTKVLATLQSVMFLEERNLLNVNARVQDYLPELQGSNKGPLRIRDLLLHQAGLVPYIPHWATTVEEGEPKPEFYNELKTPRFSEPIATRLYSIPTLRDSVWHWNIQSDLLSPRLKRGNHYVYRYSDIGFYLLHGIVERLTNQNMDAFVQNVFYAPLGLSTMGYHPLKRFTKERIAPTENDTYWRNELVWGTVHDQGAAMYGGVGGHAGLFGNATDVAILMQMNLQNGYYGGYTFLLPGTVERFIEKQPGENRRGLGWDKPVPDRDGGPTSDKVSLRTFGHTGFTGTAAWVDPEYDLVYVFLSNRVHPSAENNTLITENIRTEIQDAIYEALKDYGRAESTSLSTQR